MTSPRHIQELIDKARVYYDDKLTYHGWPHAEQVMGDVKRIIRTMGALSVQTDQDLLLVAAAWHDAGYSDPRAGEFESKEHYSVFLAKREIGQKLGEDVEILERAILATRKGVERTTAEEIILHYADIANMGYEYEVFYEFTVRLWHELGSPNWHEFLDRTEQVIGQCATEAEQELPLVGLPTTTLDSFPMRARANVARLRQEPVPQ
jgi:hypothetical protein